MILDIQGLLHAGAVAFLATLCVLGLASASTSVGEGRERQAAAGPPSQLSKEDVCRLVPLAARKEIGVSPDRASLLVQHVTAELAGEHGRIWFDVTVSENGRLIHPLARGESCGDPELVELCAWNLPGNRCSRDRKEHERWRVQVLLRVVDHDHVDSVAALVKPSRVHRHVVEATMSPVPAFRGHFERHPDGWRESRTP